MQKQLYCSFIGINNHIEIYFVKKIFFYFFKCFL